LEVVLTEAATGHPMTAPLRKSLNLLSKTVVYASKSVSVLVCFKTTTGAPYRKAISARSLADRSNEDGDIPECFLCREESVPLPPTSVPPTVRPTSAPITVTSPVSNAGGLGNDFSTVSSTNTALLVGGILGGILIVAVGMTAFVVCRRSRRNAKAIPGLNEPSIIISITVDPSEPLSDDEL
jgi:hypothetical protein